MSGPLSPVEQSKETRVITEDLLKASKDKFLQALEAQNRSLEELHQKADEVDQKVRQLSGKVRGAAVTPGGQKQKKAKSHENTQKKPLAPYRSVEVTAPPPPAAATTALVAALVAGTSRGTWRAAGRDATGRPAPPWRL